MGIVTDVVLPIALAFIMLSLGLGLTVGDFARVAKQPRDFLVGAVAQVVLLPVAAFVLVSIWPLAPELALGVMIIAAAPGGVTSNLLTAFGRGDVALSISLTAIVSLLSIVTIPFIVVFSYTHFVGGDAGDVSIAQTALGVFLIVTLPVLIGLAVRRWAEGFATRVQPNARRISALLFVLVLAAAIYQEHENALEYMGQAGPVTAVLNVVMMALAYLLARFLASGPRQRISISIECGVQNGTLAIAVSTLLFDGGLTVVPAATYSLIMFGSALIFIALLRRGTSALELARLGDGEGGDAGVLAGLEHVRIAQVIQHQIGRIQAPENLVSDGKRGDAEDAPFRGLLGAPPQRVLDLRRRDHVVGVLRCRDGPSAPATPHRRRGRAPRPIWRRTARVSARARRLGRRRGGAGAAG